MDKEDIENETCSVCGCILERNEDELCEDCEEQEQFGNKFG